MQNTSARERLADAAINPSFVVHYSCNDFTSIPAEANPVYHIVAKPIGGGPVQIFDSAQGGEASALSRFADFADAHQGHRWIHWNMRDRRFGFDHIATRAAELGTRPADIPVASRIDIAEAMVEICGRQYIGHPRLPSLMQKNEISRLGMLDVPAEVAAREAGEFGKILTSVCRKVEAVAEIFDLHTNGQLKTIPAPLPNGPHPCVFAWNEKVVALAPIPLRLLAFIWPTKGAAVSVAAQHAWGEPVSRAAITGAIGKANAALAEAGAGMAIRRKGDYLSLN